MSCSPPIRRLVFALCAWSIGGLSATGAPPKPSRVDFRRDVQPIFAARCYQCHGPDDQESGLRLDVKRAALRGGDLGKLLTPGKSAESRLMALVTGKNDDELIMPPEGKPLTATQIALLRRWIDEGAEWPDDADAKTTKAAHWSFLPPARPAPPTVRGASWVRSPIDSFVLSRLEARNLRPAPQADPATLLRRLHIDLVGLPPTLDDADRFLNDDSPDAYAKLVDRLLASPAFGERWGRYWLDQARYADSNGFEDDRQRPDAWRFRQWVIESINRDQPFDEFTIWQLAGDLLPNAGYAQRVATGFHRMTPSNEGGADAVEEEFRIIAVKDRTATTGTVWMGLTLGCAQCHSHKYDPVALGEFYSLFAFFNNADHQDIDAPPLPRRYHEQYTKALRLHKKRSGGARSAFSRYESGAFPKKMSAWESALKSGQIDGLPVAIARVVRTPAAKRTASQKAQLVGYFRTIDPEYQRLRAAANNAVDMGNSLPLPPSSKALTLAERAAARPSHIHKRGNFRDLGAAVAPGTPEFLPPLIPRGKRADRLDLARWIVDARHPLTARVAANHVWRRLFGDGLVATVDDFGRNGEPPSHPRLLDWLATEYRDAGWSRKRIVREIVMSATYRQSSRRRAEIQAIDPENRLLARQARYRVEAEVVRDIALSVSGKLVRTLGGPSFQPPLPAGLADLKELKNERFMEATEGVDGFRRGVYINVQRMLMLPMLQTFDAADANVTCPRRERSNTPLQALTLLNDPVFVGAAGALASRMATASLGGTRERIRFGFRLCSTRAPSDDELAALDRLWLHHLNHYQTRRQAAEQLVESMSFRGDLPAAEAAAWIGVARTLLNLDERITRE